MAQDSWPSPAHNSRAVTDVEYEKIATRFSDDGVYGTPADTQVVSAGTGLTVAVRAGAEASLHGHYWTSGTTGDVLAIAANVAGTTRNDWVVLRLDRSTWTVRAAIRQGTAGAGAPALVQDTGSTGVYEIPLALVTLLSGAASVTVARAELYVGARIRPCLSTHRNPTPVPGEMCYETDTGRVRLWTGSTWTSFFDDSGVIAVNSPLSAWSVTVDSVLQKKNGSVHLRLGSFQRAAGNLAGPDESRLPVLIPAAYRHPTRDQFGIAYCTGAAAGRIIVFSSATDRPGQVWLTAHPQINTGGFVLPGSGISWVVD